MRIKHSKKVFFILGVLVLSCRHKKLKIQHLSFFDNVSDTYTLGDTARADPHFVKSMHFSINQSSLKNINKDELYLNIKTDSAIQNS